MYPVARVCRSGSEEKNSPARPIASMTASSSTSASVNSCGWRTARRRRIPRNSTLPGRAGTSRGERIRRSSTRSVRARTRRRRTQPSALSDNAGNQSAASRPVRPAPPRRPCAPRRRPGSAWPGPPAAGQHQATGTRAAVPRRADTPPGPHPTRRRPEARARSRGDGLPGTTHRPPRAHSR